MPKVSKTKRKVVTSSRDSFWEYIKKNWSSDFFGKVIVVFLFPFYLFYGFCKVIWKMAEGINGVSKVVSSPFSRKCPKCDSDNIKTIKRKVPFGHYITLFFTPPPRSLHVCRDCGFSWEDR